MLLEPRSLPLSRADIEAVHQQVTRFEPLPPRLSVPRTLGLCSFKDPLMIAAMRRFLGRHPFIQQAQSQQGEHPVLEPPGQRALIILTESISQIMRDDRELFAWPNAATRSYVVGCELNFTQGFDKRFFNENGQFIGEYGNRGRPLRQNKRARVQEEDQRAKFLMILYGRTPSFTGPEKDRLSRLRPQAIGTLMRKISPKSMDTVKADQLSPLAQNLIELAWRIGENKFPPIDENTELTGIRAHEGFGFLADYIVRRNPHLQDQTLDIILEAMQAEARALLMNS